MRGHSDLILVFVNILCHADQDGIVDRHWQAIADETGLSPARVKSALLELEGPDNQSRTRTDDGRRLKRIDQDRDWGWQIVNFQHYRELRTTEERREYHRLYKAKQRENANKNDNVNKCQQMSTMSTNAEAYADADTKEEEEEEAPPPGQVENKFSKAIQKLRDGHPAFKTVPDMALENSLKGWPQERWDEAIESLCRRYAGAHIMRPIPTLENHLAGSNQRKKATRSPEREFDLAVANCVEKLWQVKLVDGDFARELATCRDKYKDVPKQNGRDVIATALEMVKAREYKK